MANICLNWLIINVTYKTGGRLSAFHYSVRSYKVHKSGSGKMLPKTKPVFCEQEMLSGRKGWGSGTNTNGDVFMKGIELVVVGNQGSLGNRGSTPSATGKPVNTE